MSRTLPAQLDIVSLIAGAADIQAQVELSILNGDEAETDRLSRLYEIEIDKIFASRGANQEQLIAKLVYSQQLLIAEHPMPLLVKVIFDSLCKDVKAIVRDPKEVPQTSGSS